MPLLRELGAAVRQRRREIGISQQELAELAGLSRVTISGLESGTINDLSSARIERVANELGFALGVVGTRRKHDGNALEAAARVASVPYRKVLPASTLQDSLRTGAIPPGYIPHMRTLLQEAPIAILADVVEQMHDEGAIPRPDTWTRMRALAMVLKCDRGLWRTPST